MRHFYPEKTKVVFFDLEYYVPIQDRDRDSPGTMAFAPVLPDHKILGGTFLSYYPIQDRLGTRSTFWEWRSGSEKEVLREIYTLLEHEWRSISHKNQAGSLMVAGIGISHSDMPALLVRLLAHSIADRARVYDIVCGCRHIDLSTATYCQFSFNHGYFAYPKTKKALYQKYLGGKKMESGKTVWELYEAGNFDAIEQRSHEEIDDMLAIYKAMFDLKKQDDVRIARMKRLEKKELSLSIQDTHAEDHKPTSVAPDSL